ncbi:MAG: type VI secretion system tube protein Hcp [Azoarcus sp.]|jgi:type VI secretion system secreted protein Hcp|nr:type VI secretion system tube protein Hcp [Azoarcus sp.]
MTQEVFIKLDGIAGESKQAKHQGWIDVLDYNYRVTQSASLYSGGGGGVGRADFPPLTFSHYIDKASPNLFKYCAAGKHIKEVVLSACKAGGGSKEFLNIKLFQVMVVDVNPSGSSGGQTVETVSLAYGKIEIRVKEQSAGGTMDTEVVGKWNVQANSEDG